MLDKIKELARKHDLLAEQLADPAVYGDPEKLKKLNQELRELSPAAEACRAYEQAAADRTAAEALLDDPEMGELAAEELSQAQIGRAHV